jgi:hypothetical protein
MPRQSSGANQRIFTMETLYDRADPGNSFPQPPDPPPQRTEHPPPTDTVRADWGAVIDGCRDLLAVAFGTNSSMDDAFGWACRDADKAATQPQDPRILRARRLLADDVSYEHAYAEFMRERPTPEAAIDALVSALRRGIAELTEPDILRRLSELDKGRLKAICRRLQNFKPEIAPPWPPEDVAALIAKWRELHG